MNVKVYALAQWIFNQLTDEERWKTCDSISRQGVYSAFHGSFWVRITRSRSEYHGQIDQVGVGARFTLLENNLKLQVPLAAFEKHLALIDSKALTLRKLVEAPDIPDLAVLNARHDRQAFYGLASQWSRMEEAAFWNLPKSGKETCSQIGHVSV